LGKTFFGKKAFPQTPFQKTLYQFDKIFAPKSLASDNNGIATPSARVRNDNLLLLFWQNGIKSYQKNSVFSVPSV
jgi:hypothetical protein